MTRSRTRWGRALISWLSFYTTGRFFLQDPQVLGRRGEGIACRELERQGYTVVDRRARGRLGEIDIVAWDGPVLAFIEVKTRSGTGYGSPAEAVGWRKQRKLVALARAYLARKGMVEPPVRFDVVGVEVRRGGRPKVELLRGAFLDA